MEISNDDKKKFGSKWVFLSLIPCFNGLGLIVAGSRAKCKKWKVLGLIYISLAWVLESLKFSDACVVSWIVSVIHTIYIKKEYFVRMKVLEESKDIIVAKQEAQDKKLVDKVYKDIFGEDKQNFINKMETKNDKQAETKPMETVKTVSETIKKLDINTCSDVELSQVPGIGIILSKKAMDVKKDQGKFNSIDEFYELLNIAFEKRDKLDKYLDCNTDKILEKFETKQDDKVLESTSEEKFKNKNMGRKIDF